MRPVVYEGLAGDTTFVFWLKTFHRMFQLKEISGDSGVWIFFLCAKCFVSAL